MRFFIYIFIIALAIGAMLLAAFVYSYSTKADVEPVVFQVANYPEGRPDIVPLDDISDDAMIDWLIRRWFVEAYRVIPDNQDAAERMAGGRASFIGFMSDSGGERVWREEVLPEVQDIASRRGMRAVHVISVAQEGEYYRVEFRLDTWDGPDSMRSEVRVAYVKVRYEPGLIENWERELRRSSDAARIFKFRVSDFRVRR
ncbi:MAG: hypothetical protein FWD33_02500 [Alphaproteobacteria bacterium]|nr:hypothetical protein [Alphaproteobacteria bacterium]